MTWEIQVCDNGGWARGPPKAEALRAYGGMLHQEILKIRSSEMQKKKKSYEFKTYFDQQHGSTAGR